MYNFTFVAQLADAIAITDGNVFGPGTGFIFLDNMGCRGDETNLNDCTHNVVGVHDCGHGEDAGVICPPQGRIVGTTVTLMLYVTPLSPSYVCPELYRCWQFLVSMPHGVTCLILHRDF